MHLPSIGIVQPSNSVVSNVAIVDSMISGAATGGSDVEEGVARGTARSRQCVRFTRPQRTNVAYRVRLFPCIQRRFLIRFDRLQLASLFDK